mmetsp:Transcript_160304/g.510191  ORF Transcript_160304/g.510191 Transcript_160304/m.510191 type:complete len:272 (+) Transcript_160304:2017-2832(+)
MNDLKRDAWNSPLPWARFTRSSWQARGMACTGNVRATTTYGPVRPRSRCRYFAAEGRDEGSSDGNEDGCWRRWSTCRWPPSPTSLWVSPPSVPSTGGEANHSTTGIVGVPRHKLHCLLQITRYVAHHGFVDQELLESLVGSWAFCFLFRRPMFSIFVHVYKNLQPEGTSRSTNYRLTHAARNELYLACILGSLTLSSLRAEPTEYIYSSDASPSAAGIVLARVGPEVAGELYRRSEQGGWRAGLLGPCSAALRELGFDVDEAPVPAEHAVV